MSRRARELTVLLIAVALGVAMFAGCGGDDDDDSESEPKTEATSPAPEESAVETAANNFLDTYVKPDGRVERTDQGGDTVGEGQAYGMLIAAAIGDEQRFDAMWDWTKANIRRPDGLISFLWKDGRVQDPEPASDADVDAVRALLAASCRFERPELRQEALDLANAIMELETIPFDGGPLLVAGPWARKNPITLNPSYFSPSTFAVLGEVTGDGRWGSLSASARAISGALMTEETPLPPDWAQLRGGKPVPSGPPGEPESTSLYGFDAARTLVRLAEDPDPAGREIAAVAWPVFEGKPPGDIPMEYDLTGEAAGDASHPLALVAAAGAAHAAGDDAAMGTLLDAAEELDKGQPTYYGAAWVALGRIMLTTSDLDPCP